MNDIIVDIDVIVPSSVTADAEYSMPVVKELEKTDIFRHNTLVAFDGDTYQS